MRIKTVTSTAVTAALVCLLAFGGGAIGAPPIDPGEEVAGNNLSYPAVLIGPFTSTAPFFTVTNEGLGTTYSFGCDRPEVSGVFSYPNTSCVDDLMDPTIHYSAEACIQVGAPCAGLNVSDLSRMYWQKKEDSQWSSQITGVPTTSSSVPVFVRYVDWGDSIEVVNWSDYSILRVETQPFVDLSQDSLPEVIPEADTQAGFQMWHVSGQGITEQWGARVEEDAGARGLPYVYQSPYAIINAGTADLYITKLSPLGDDAVGYECPAMEGGVDRVYPDDYPFRRDWTDGTGWSNSCNLETVPYTLEQSVSGKFVHGYNWRVRSYPEYLAACGTGWHKTGWWRLTYVPNGGASKMSFTTNTVTSAPEIPPAIPTILSSLLEESEEDETETTLYTPVVDVANNVTYIDICIVAKTPTAPAQFIVHPYVNVTGSGTITPDVSQSVATTGDETVSFTLTPDTGYTFDANGITGTCPAGADPTTTNGGATWSYTTGGITSDCTVIANFYGVETNQHSLTVNTVGSGTVSSDGIACPGDCTENYPANTEVTLTAAPAPGSVFTGWSGACTGVGTVAKVTVDVDKTCTATFTGLLYTITASASPAAGGVVTCDPDSDLLSGETSACTITPNDHYTFDTVDIVTPGTCPAGAPPTDNLDGTWSYTTGAISADCSVVAVFDAEQFELTVSTVGSGTVSSDGIACPDDCSEVYDYNTVVTLTATAGADSAFAGWSGACTGVETVAKVTMDAAKSCIATFEAGYLITASASPAEGGGVNCVPNPVLDGSNSDCTIIPNPHYTLGEVTSTCGDGTLDVVGNIYTTDASSVDCTVIATFEKVFSWSMFMPAITHKATP